MSTTTTPSTQAQRTELSIMERLDKQIANAVQLDTAGGGLTFHNVGEALEVAKLMSVSQQSVPKHCRNQPGVCLGLLIQALEWRMSPYAVARKSYVVNDIISYESQLIHAVIEQRAPITARLRHSFSGEGDSRRCKVWATAKGESEPLVYESPEFGKITPKNSPLWKSKPDLQLYYNASRDWARMYFPDVIMGVYAEDELDAVPSHPAPRPAAGMSGLRSTLLGHDQDTADDQQRDGFDDAPEDDGNQGEHADDVNQETQHSDAPQMSAEEIADHEREMREHGGEQRSLIDKGHEEYR